MKINGDYHLHTRYSDGRCSSFAHAKKAKQLGLEEIAVTDHSFASFIFHMTKRKWAKLTGEIDGIDGIRVLKGIEGNIINDSGDIDVPCDIIRDSDILLCGFHRFLGFDYVNKAPNFIKVNGYGSLKDRERIKDINTLAIINALRRYPIDVIAHLNHRMIVDVMAVCEEARVQGVYVELNAKHLDALENSAKDMIDSGVNFIIGTDAHDTRKTGKLKRVEDFILRHDIPLDRVYGVDDNLPKFKDKKDWNNGI